MFKKLNILQIFFNEPTREFNVRELARILKVSPATASKELKKLAAEGFLKERQERMLKLYKSSLDDDSYRDLKLYYTIRILKESGLIQALNQFYLKPTLVLFGSAAHSLDTETSDLDLLVISEKKQEISGLPLFEKRIKRKIHLFIVRTIKDLKNEYLINNVLNGIVLQGKIKWI